MGQEGIVTIPAGEAERREKLERLQERLERAQEALDGQGSPWYYHRAQERTQAALRRTAALYKRS